MKIDRAPSTPQPYAVLTVTREELALIYNAVNARYVPGELAFYNKMLKTFVSFLAFNSIEEDRK